MIVIFEKFGTSLLFYVLIAYDLSAGKIKLTEILFNTIAVKEVDESNLRISLKKFLFVESFFLFKCFDTLLKRIDVSNLSA